MTRVAACPVACLFLVLAAACGTPEGRSTNGETATAGYTIGPGGAAGLTGQTPFTVPALERAFPGLEVISVPAADPPAFHIREPGAQAPLYIVTPDWTRGYAGAVATRSASVTGPDGIRAGEARYSGLPESWKADCAAETDAPIICEQQAGTGSFRLRFRAGSDDPLLEEMAFLPPVP